MSKRLTKATDKLELMQKLMRVQIQPEVLLGLFTEKSIIIEADGREHETIKGLPKGSKFKGWNINVEYNCLELVVENEEFEPLTYAERIPIHSEIEIKTYFIPENK